MSYKAYVYLFALLMALASTVACGGGSLSATKNAPSNGNSTSSTNSTASSDSSGVWAKSNFMSSFAAGIAHASGNYGFTQENYLQEGAERIRQLGSDSIFIYLTPQFRTTYPDKSSASWPAQDPSYISDLIQAEPYKKVLSMGFKTIVLTTYTFANNDHVAGFAANGNIQAEENEFYNLATYLLRTYANTGMTFILKNWEGDWIGLQGNDTSQNLSNSMANDMIAWLSARQRGVTRARQDAGNPAGVNVFNAVEVNRVLDYAQKKMNRVVNAVVPAVGADMVTYSSYDSTLAGTDPNSMQAAMTQALNTIKQLAPDPLGLGSKRVLISEFGLYENQQESEAVWRTNTVLKTAQSAGLAGAFMWNVFDNECHEPDGQTAPIDTSLGDPTRPNDSECRGLWAVRPDGSVSSVVGVLQGYFGGSN